MVRIRRLALAALVVAAGLVSSGPATAGDLWDHLTHQCPSPSYSPFRYWTPCLARVSDCIHGPRIDVYPPDRHPEVPPSFFNLRYRCRPADPAATLVPVPTPPK
jgi:hypothetical protein